MAIFWHIWGTFCDILASFEGYFGQGDGFIGIFAGHPGSHDGYANQLSHMYSNAGGIYRGFRDIGEMWSSVGAKHSRPDVAAHGKELLAIAPKLRA